MKIGVPGEFHEDRWQRTAEDSETPVFPRTREAGVTHRIQVIAWQSGLLTGLRHGDLAHRYLSGIIAWQRGHLSALWHGGSSQKYFRGIPVWRRGASDLPFGTGTLNRTTSEMALRGEGTFSRIRIIKDYRTYFFNSNSGNLERKAICR